MKLAISDILCLIRKCIDDIEDDVLYSEKKNPGANQQVVDKLIELATMLKEK